MRAQCAAPPSLATSTGVRGSLTSGAFSMLAASLLGRHGSSPAPRADPHPAPICPSLAPS